MTVHDGIHELLQEHVDYWRIRQHAREHLASIQDLSSGSVKQEIRKHLKSSGSSLKLQNLAYSLKHGLFLPFDTEAADLDHSAAERARTGAGEPLCATQEGASASLPPEPAAAASEVSIKAPQTPEYASTSTSPVPAASPLHTTFSLQERVSPSLQAGHATHSVSPGKLASPHTAAGGAPLGSVTKDGQLQHGDSALPTKELHEARQQPQHRPKQPPEPPQLQLLRDHWQAVVVDRLMRVAARSGEPLARRARDPGDLARLRAADATSSFVGDCDPSFSGDNGPATSAAHRIGRQGALEPPPLGKPPVDTPVISMPLLKRGISAAMRGDGQAILDLPQPTVASTPDAICPEIEAQVPTWAQLRERFADLHPRLRHVGMDDSNCEWFAARSLAIAGAAAESQKLPDVRSVLRRGAPRSQRRSLWCLGLCLPQHIARAAGQSSHGDDRFLQLCEAVESRQLLTDALISHSVEALANSDDFFLFTETIRAATLAFSRDASVAANSAMPAHPRLIGLGKGGQRHGLYPPCGVLPPTWLSSLVAPLVYVFGDAEGVFYCTRALYCRYWCKLSSLSAEGGPSPCMPVLVATFQRLLNEAEPDLEAHLHSVGFSPAHCAIKWMVSGFVNALDVEEVLLLWDRMIGFDTLLVFAIAAVGIFTWRARMLRSCCGRREAEAALQHLAGVRAVPLLQSVLFLCGGSACAALGIDMEDSTGDVVYTI